MPIYNEASSDFDGAVLVGALADPVTVTQDGTVSNKLGGNGSAFHLQNGAYVATINGQVSSTSGLATGYGIFIDAANTGPLSKISIGTAGNVSSLSTSAIRALHATDVTNLGLVKTMSGQPAIHITAETSHKIVNKGRIEGTVGTSLFIPDANSDVLDGEFADAVVMQGAGQHSLTNSGFIVGNIAADAGNTIVSNSGKIAGIVATGSGNDKVTNTGVIQGVVTLGAGNDVYSGSKGMDYVTDDAGKDSYKLGDGIDFFIANWGGSGDSIDTIDGGANTPDPFLSKIGLLDENYPVNMVYGDAYIITPGHENFAIYVNMDSKAITAHVVVAGTFAASTATGTDVGIDIIKNFEMILGGTHNDIIFGNAAANYLYGQDGDDSIFGGAGNDIIYGGLGYDHLGGDGGADFIFCNDPDALEDYTEDLIYFLTLKDSTVALTGRDRIYDFVDNSDRFSFEFLNLPTFANVILDAAFSIGSLVPEIRCLSTALGWTVQLDINGDRKADMAFDVVDEGHAIAWDPTDFLC